MLRFIASVALALTLLAPSVALAVERTVTLAVRNMYCATCPYTVEASLEAVPGVLEVMVSYKEKTAVVSYDDARTSVAALTRATTDAGYPSEPEQ